jgi:hypothetical protein
VVNSSVINGGQEVPGYWQPQGRTHSTRLIKRLVSRPGGLILRDMWMRPQGKDRCASIQRSGRPSPRVRSSLTGEPAGGELLTVALNCQPQRSPTCHYRRVLGGPRWGRTVLAVPRRMG